MPSPNSRCTLASRTAAGSRAPCRAGRATARCCRPRRPRSSARPPGSRSRCRSRARGPACLWLPASAVRPQQQLDHAGHHTRLGDGLAQADRQAGVFVRLVDQRAVDEAMPLDAPIARSTRGSLMPCAASFCTMRARTACESRPTPAVVRLDRHGGHAPASGGGSRGARHRAGGKTGRRVMDSVNCQTRRPSGAISAALAWSVRSTCSGVMWDVALQRGVEVGALGIVLGLAGAADPVHRLAARAVCEITFSAAWRAQPADLDGLQFIAAVRDVHVQQPVRAVGAWSRSGTAAPARAPCARRIEVRPALLDLRERDGRNAEQVASIAAPTVPE
jgi:hypothetical protein